MFILKQQMRLKEIVLRPDGSAYFIYILPKVKRGIRGKSRGHVDETIIVGVPRGKVLKYCLDEGIEIENLYNEEGKNILELL